VRRDPVVIVWGVGLVVAVLIYLAGPEHFFVWLFDLLDRARASLEQAIENLSQAGFNLLRAVAVGLFVVFVALSLMVIRAGRRGRAALLLVGGTFLVLVSTRSGYNANTRWAGALALAGVGAAVMTQRLRGPASPVRR
jgi:hypothetical protein